MRVPLPGRDYFPPRVLLRGAPSPMREVPRPDRRDQAGGGLVARSVVQAALPASPPAPMAGLRPAAA